MIGLVCLATAIFFEARDQSVTGQFAVADVILNRVAHDKFPDNICDVVFDGKAFSFTHDGLSDDMHVFNQPEDIEAAELALIIAEEAIAMQKYQTTDLTHYHTVDVNPVWAEHPDFYLAGIIGDHKFYACSGYC